MRLRLLAVRHILGVGVVATGALLSLLLGRMLLVLVGLGAVVYVKVLRASPEQRACERLADLCGKNKVADVGECTKELDEASGVLGAKYIDKASDCIDDATTCVEAIGCAVGAGQILLDEFQRGVDRARQ